MNLPIPEAMADDPALAPLVRAETEAGNLRSMLGIMRRHLGMDVAFLAHFQDPDRVLRLVDVGSASPLHEGKIVPLSEGYCLKVVRGELPGFIADTACVPAATTIPATHELPIGSHLSVPVRLDDGTLYGTLCCLSHKPNHRLVPRDMWLLRALAEIVALRLNALEAGMRAREAAIQEIESAIACGMPRLVYQPVFDVAGRTLRGFECLARFDTPTRSPDQWFLRAQLVGLGTRLELAAARAAVHSRSDFPDDTVFAINASPELLLSSELRELLCGVDGPARLTLELTEHAQVRDYEALEAALAPLRALGVRIAVDDAGAGFASMRHILRLRPDLIKLDVSLTRGVHLDRSRQSLARNLTGFAHEIGAQIVAEGVECAEELETLQAVGVDQAQGYFLARPMPKDEAVALATAHAMV